MSINASTRKRQPMVKTLEIDSIVLNLGTTDNETEKKIRRMIFRTFVKAEKMARKLGTKDSHELTNRYEVFTMGQIGESEPFLLNENDSTEFVKETDDSDDSEDSKDSDD